MELEKINRILADTAYTRVSGTEAETRCAKYLAEECAALGMQAHLEAFEVPMAVMGKAELWCDGELIPCKGYFCAGSADVEAPLYYLSSDDPASMAECQGKIVLVDGPMRYWTYQDILKNGAAGFISYDGNANYADEDIDQKELRSSVHQGRRLPGVNINAKQAIRLVEQNIKTARIVLEQEENIGYSHNVIAELPGKTDEWIVLTAHYDTTSLSQGAYDNMSGAIGLLGLAEKLIHEKHRFGLRFVFCGSEERGLLGSKAYVSMHGDELEKIVLNVNLDMIGCIMGGLIACCTAEDKLVHFVEYLGAMEGFGVKARQGVYASDSTPFADKGVPALSFARIAPQNTATIHNRYDTLAVLKAEQLSRDVDFLFSFTEKMANARYCPVAREIPEKMKEKLDYYLNRKREKKE